MAPTDTFVCIIIAVLIVAGWLGSRKFLGKQPSDPMRETAAKLKAAGFVAYPTPHDEAPRMCMKNETPIFSVHHSENCASCQGKLYLLGCLRQEPEDGYPREYIDVFGITCPHCAWLEKLAGRLRKVPSPLRDRWIRSADLPDFLRRVAQRWN